MTEKTRKTGRVKGRKNNVWIEKGRLSGSHGRALSWWGFARDTWMVTDGSACVARHWGKEHKTLPSISVRPETRGSVLLILRGPMLLTMSAAAVRYIRRRSPGP